MIVKVFGLLLLAVAVTSGDPKKMTHIFLKDETFTFQTDELIGKTLTIPKFTFDVLKSCHVVLPSGAMVEVYPHNELNDPFISFLNAVEPFRSCAIGFRGAPTTHSGTYELYSVVQDSTNANLSLTRKKFHLTFVDIEPWNAKD